MACKALSIVGLIVVLVAVIVSLQFFEEHRAKLHHVLASVMSTCPYHMVLSVLSGFSSESKSNTEQGGVYNCIRRGNDRLYTKDELSEYHGGEGAKGLLIGILGLVYDVEAAPQFYGPDGGYSFFRACDGTKAFMTGEFNKEGLVDEVEGLTPPQMLELENWIKFYDNHEKYKYKGKLVGNFYNSDGEPTQMLLDAQQAMVSAYEDKMIQEEERRWFPNCNGEFKQDTGGRVWCSNKSGGTEREWIGVPRKFFIGENSRCVCVRTSGPPWDDPNNESSDIGDLDNPHLQEYDHCDYYSISCFTTKPELNQQSD